MSKTNQTPSTDVLYTYETKNTISLQFNHDALQSVMRKSDPFALEFEYTQVMMTFMVLQEAFKHILLIGLGGGSLSKFCYKHLPTTKITTVEINPEVISYRDKFQIPANNQRFKIIEADGADYIQQRINDCDVILLDAYDGQGMPDAIASEQFFQHRLPFVRPAGGGRAPSTQGPAPRFTAGPTHQFPFLGGSSANSSSNFSSGGAPS